MRLPDVVQMRACGVVLGVRENPSVLVVIPALDVPRMRSDAVTEYPILVRRFAGQQPMVIICEACEAEMVLLPDDLLNEGYYACPDGCPGGATYKYEQGDSCRGCKRLGFWSNQGGCCSRVCKLQVEYAEQLRLERNQASAASAVDAPGSALSEGPPGATYEGGAHGPIR